MKKEVQARKKGRQKNRERNKKKNKKKKKTSQRWSETKSWRMNESCCLFGMEDEGALGKSGTSEGGWR